MKHDARASVVMSSSRVHMAQSFQSRKEAVSETGTEASDTASIVSPAVNQSAIWLVVNRRMASPRVAQQGHQLIKQRVQRGTTCEVQAHLQHRIHILFNMVNLIPGFHTAWPYGPAMMPCEETHGLTRAGPISRSRCISHTQH